SAGGTSSTSTNGGTSAFSSVSDVVSIVVNAVNDAPSFTKGSNQTVDEDGGAQSVSGWASSLSSGPTNESGQTLTFTVSNDNNSLFSTQPVVSSAGALTYTAASDANGSATVRVLLKDDGGTTNSGVDSMASQTFTITVNAVNVAPSFTKGSNQTVDEDAGAQSVSGWATSLSKGPSNESGQSLTFTVTNNNNSLFSSQPAISSAGALTYTPASNAHGSATVRVLLKDDGGTANSGVDSMASQTFTITVSPVADTPSITNATTTEDVQTSSGLVISRNANDGTEVTHYKVTNIANGTLYKNDGTTQINDGDFITYAEGHGGLKFTPPLNSTSDRSFAIQASTSNADADLGGSTVEAVVTVNHVADTPSITNATTIEDVPATVVVVRNPLDGEEVTHFKVTAISNGALFLSDGTTPISDGDFVFFAEGYAGLKFAPAPNSTADGHFNVQASLGVGDSYLGGGIAEGIISIIPTVDDPSVTNASTIEDTQTTSGLAVSPNPADGPLVTHFKITDIENGTLFWNDGTTPIADGAFITVSEGNLGLKFTPQPNSTESGNFVVQASTSDTDAGLGGARITATITVDSVNDFPTPADDIVATEEDVAAAVLVLANDVDADGDALVVVDVTQGSNGTVSIVDGSTVSYTPNDNFTGEDTFTYTVSDGQGGTATGTVQITVTPANDVPTVVDDAIQVQEDTEGTVPVLANDSDIDGDALTVVSVTQGATGAVSVANDSTVSYTPNGNFTGEDTFTYTVSDGQGGTATGTVQVTVTPVNDVPILLDDAIEMVSDALGEIPVIVNDVDADGDTLTVVAVTQGSNGTVSIGDGSTVSYVPNDNFSGEDTFTYTVSDGKGGTATATVVVSVERLNTSPVAVDDTVETLEDASVTISVLDNDTDENQDVLTITEVSSGTMGSVGIVDGTDVTYSPDENKSGSDSFIYTVSDGHGGTATGTIFVTVTEVNDAPVAIDDIVTGKSNAPVAISVLLNDSDLDGDALTVAAVTQGANGSVSITDGNLVIYLPNVGFAGEDAFAYTLSDGREGTATGAVTVTIPINDRAADGQLGQTPQMLAGEALQVVLQDNDFNLSDAEIDVVRVTTTNQRTGEQESPVLSETGPNTGIFSSTIGTIFTGGHGVDLDGVLVVEGGDVLVSRYRDDLTTKGIPVDRTAETTIRPTRFSLTPNPQTIVANGTDQSILQARVTDDAGRPLPDGALVQFTADNGTFDNGIGQITIPVVGGDGRADAIYTAPILGQRETVRVLASFGGVNSDIVKLDVLPGAIAIRVYDQARDVQVGGEDLELSVDIRLSGTTVTGDPIEISVTVDANGVFVVPELPPGNYELKALVVEMATGRVVSDGVLQKVEVKTDGSVAPPKNAVSGSLQATHDDTQMGGSVVELLDQNGQVVAQTTTDAEGRYDFQDLPAGDYTLRAQLPDGKVVKSPVNAQSRLNGAMVVNANILIDPFGRLFAVDSGASVVGATVALRHLTGDILPIPLLDGTGASPNVNNINPYVSNAEGRYAFLFSGDQVGSVDVPAVYHLTVTPPSASNFLPRRFLIKVRPSKEGPVDQVPITMVAESADGLELAIPNGQALTSDPVVVPNIETDAFNIPMYSQAASLEFSKSTSVETASVGQTVDFQMRLSNVGNDTARTLTVVDTLTEEWRLVKADGGTIVGPNVVRWQVDHLQPGEVQTFNLTALLVKEADGELINRAWVNGVGAQSIESPVSLKMQPAADIQLTKLADVDTVGLSDEVTYTIVVENRDVNLQSKAFAVVDALPAGLTFVSATRAPSVSDNLVTWQFDTLAPGATDTLQIVAQLTRNVTDLVNTVRAFLDNQEIATSGVTVAVRNRPNLQINKLADQLVVELGQALRYEISVGSPEDTLSSVMVRDSLPSDFAYVPNSAQPASVYDSQSHVLSWQLDSILPSAPQTLSFDVVPVAGLAPGEYGTQNRATALANGYSFTSEAADVVVSVPFFSVEKTAGAQSAGVGDFVSYAVVLRNLSARDNLSAIALRDQFPLGFAYVKKSARLDGVSFEPDSLSHGAAVWRVAGLAAGEEKRLTYRMVVGVSAQAGDGNNVLTATAQTPRGHVLSVGPTEARVEVQPEIFTQDEIILGRAWVDLDGNGVMNDGEPPVPKVELMMEDGARIVADAHGRFSIPESKIGDHVIRLLEQSVPADLEPVLLGTRSGDDPWIRFVSLSKSGLAKANFPFKTMLKPEPQKYRIKFERRLELDILAPFVVKGVLFVSASDELADPGDLPQVVARMQADIDQKIRVGGHTDSLRISSRRFTNNQVLSQKRAESVKAYLVASGIDSSRIEAISYGATHPVATNSTESGRRQNRRVEIEPVQSSIQKFTYTLAMDTTSVIETPLKVIQDLPVSARFVDGTDNPFDMTPGDSLVQKLWVEGFDWPMLPAPRIGHPDLGTVALRSADTDAIKERSTWYLDVLVLMVQDTSVSHRSGRKTRGSKGAAMSEGSLKPVLRVVSEGGLPGVLTVGQERSVLSVEATADSLSGAGIGAALDRSAAPASDPAEEDWMVVGMATGQLGWEFDEAVTSGLGHGSGAYTRGKAAVFARGTLRDRYKLTLSYDSERTSDDQVFRFLTPERAFPIYGDASSIFYEAPSTHPLFARVEKDRSFVQIGDFATGLSGTELAAYNRSFFGVSSRLNVDAVQIDLFGASTDQTLRVDEVPGEGISGPYYTAAAGRRGALVVGSERVIIQTRDRLHPEVVLDETQQYRFTDYEIDYNAGTLLFKRSVPSHSADENPIFIVITYETTRALAKQAVAGGRIKLNPQENLAFGATLAGEERVGDNYWLMGVDGRWQPLTGLTLTSEFARSVDQNTGNAWKVGVGGALHSKVRYEFYYRDAEATFYNPNSPTVRAGVRKLRGQTTWSVSDALDLTGEAYQIDDSTNLDTRKSLLLGGTLRADRVTGNSSVEISQRDFHGVETQTAVWNTGLTWDISQRLSLGISRDQAFGDQDLTYRPTLNRLQTRWQLDDRFDLVGEHVFRDGGFVDSSYTTVGLQSRVSDDLTAYAKYELDGGINGQRNQAIVGLKHQYHLGEDVTFHTALERVKTLRGNRQNDFTAFSIAGEYLPPEPVKATGRFEKRNGRILDKTLVSGAADIALNSGWALLGKHIYTGESQQSAFANGTMNNHHFLTGLAYRGNRADWLNALGKYEYKRREDDLGKTTVAKHIGSLEVILEPYAQIEWFVRYAFKVAHLDAEGIASRTLTDLWMTHVRYEWYRKVDLLGEYRLLKQHTVGDFSHGFAFESGYILKRNMRLALGYNFAGYHDGDFAGIDAWAQGPYLKIQVKFTESDVAAALKGFHILWRD
ncbi:MAG: putative repeat protein (TIGR01451 family), partial [Candidatus Latescibacterota bacterium]